MFDRQFYHNFRFRHGNGIHQIKVFFEKCKSLLYLVQCITLYRGITIKNPPYSWGTLQTFENETDLIRSAFLKSLAREARLKFFSTFLVFYSAKTLKKWFSGRFGFQKNELRSALRFESQTDLIRSASKHLKIWPDLDLKGGVLNSNTPVPYQSMILVSAGNYNCLLNSSTIWITL